MQFDGYLEGFLRKRKKRDFLRKSPLPVGQIGQIWPFLASPKMSIFGDFGRRDKGKITDFPQNWLANFAIGL